MDKINNAGGFFLGEHSFEALGDYVAGPQPMSCPLAARPRSFPVNLLDFVKLSSVVAPRSRNSIHPQPLRQQNFADPKN